MSTGGRKYCKYLYSHCHIPHITARNSLPKPPNPTARSAPPYSYTQFFYFSRVIPRKTKEKHFFCPPPFFSSIILYRQKQISPVFTDRAARTTWGERRTGTEKNNIELGEGGKNQRVWVDKGKKPKVFNLTNLKKRKVN